MTPLDFLDLIFHRLPINSSSLDMAEIKQRVQTMIAFSATEYKFSYLNPSLLAASAIYATLSCLLSCVSPADAKDDLLASLRQLLLSLQTVTHSEAVSFKTKFVNNEKTF